MVVIGVVVVVGGGVVVEGGGFAVVAFWQDSKSGEVGPLTQFGQLVMLEGEYKPQYLNETFKMIFSVWDLRFTLPVLHSRIGGSIVCCNG